MDGLHAEAHILAGLVTHAHHLFYGQAQANGGSVEHGLIQIHGAEGNTLGITGYKTLNQLDKGVHKGHKEQGIDNIKGGVSIGDLAGNIS